MKAKRQKIEKTEVFGLPSNALIATRMGYTFVSKLREGDFVWSLDLQGNRKQSRLLQVIRFEVPSKYTITQVFLSDGRHIEANTAFLKNLQKGDIFDNAEVVAKKRIEYKNKFVYEILPDSETGLYWVSNVLFKSSLIKENRSLLTVVTKFGSLLESFRLKSTPLATR